MSHISPDRVNALLTGEAPVEELRALISHLESGCEDCDKLLEDRLDLETLAMLVEAQEGGPTAPDAQESEAIWAASAPQRPANRGVWTGVGVVLLLAAAAAVMFTGVLAPNPRFDVDEGVKGTDRTPVETPVDVELRVLVGVTTEDGFSLEGRLEEGATVDAQSTLIFELDANQFAARYLFAVDADGTSTQLFPKRAESRVEKAGRRRVLSGRDWVALGLEDWSGPITLVGAVAKPPLPADEVIDTFGRNEKRSAELAFDVLNAVVEP